MLRRFIEKIKEIEERQYSFYVKNGIHLKYTNVILLNCFFSFYEDIFKRLLNLHIENKFGKNSYEFLNYRFSFFNDKHTSYEKEAKNFAFPKNEKYFYEFKNTFYHKNIKEHKKIKEWFLDAKKNIKFFINNVQILNKLEDMEKFIQRTSELVRTLYKYRNLYNHSFEYWDNHTQILDEEIHSLFLMLFFRIIIFDLYLNDVLKSSKYMKKITKEKKISCNLYSNKFLSDMKQVIGNDKYQHIQDNNINIEIKILVN